jgi:hypothetical protein
MDIRLPGMNGTDALIAIRKEFPNALVIMLTSSDGNAEIDRALRAGAAGYILKSMPRVELLAVIRAVKSGRRHIPTEIDKCIWKLFPNCNESIGAVHSGKSNIHQRDVRLVNTELQHGLFGIRSLGDKNHVLLRANDDREALANKWMILNAKNPNWIADGHSRHFKQGLLSFANHPLAYISRTVDDLRSARFTRHEESNHIYIDDCHFS